MADRGRTRGGRSCNGCSLRRSFASRVVTPTNGNKLESPRFKGYVKNQILLHLIIHMNNGKSNIFGGPFRHVKPS
jgi:hypothetical protein